MDYYAINGQIDKKFYTLAVFNLIKIKHGLRYILMNSFVNQINIRTSAIFPGDCLRNITVLRDGHG